MITFSWKRLGLQIPHRLLPSFGWMMHCAAHSNWTGLSPWWMQSTFTFRQTPLVVFLVCCVCSSLSLSLSPSRCVSWKKRRRGEDKYDEDDAEEGDCKPFSKGVAAAIRDCPCVWIFFRKRILTHSNERCTSQLAGQHNTCLVLMFNNPAPHPPPPCSTSSV